MTKNCKIFPFLLGNDKKTGACVFFHKQRLFHPAASLLYMAFARGQPFLYARRNGLSFFLCCCWLPKPFQKSIFIQHGNPQFLRFFLFRRRRMQIIADQIGCFFGDTARYLAALGLNICRQFLSICIMMQVPAVYRLLSELWNIYADQAPAVS